MRTRGLPAAPVPASELASLGGQRSRFSLPPPGLWFRRALPRRRWQWTYFSLLNTMNSFRTVSKHCCRCPFCQRAQTGGRKGRAITQGALTKETGRPETGLHGTADAWGWGPTKQQERP